MSLKKWSIPIVLVVGILFGYGQEYIKIAINFANECAAGTRWDNLSGTERLSQLDDCRLHRPSDYYHNHQPLKVLSRISIRGLVVLKWALAFFFVLFHWCIARWGLSRAYANEFPLKFLDIGISLLLVISAAIFLTGRMFGIPPAYDVAREILGGLQSLIPFVILIFGYTLYLRLNN